MYTLPKVASANIKLCFEAENLAEACSGLQHGLGQQNKEISNRTCKIINENTSEYIIKVFKRQNLLSFQAVKNHVLQLIG